MCRIEDVEMSTTNDTSNLGQKKVESWIDTVPYCLDVIQNASDDLYKLLLWFWLFCLLQAYLFYREISTYNSTKFPKILEKYWTESEFENSRQQGIRNMRTSLFVLICKYGRLTTFTILLLTGCIRILWDISAHIMKQEPIDDSYRDFYQMYLFSFLVNLVYQVISVAFKNSSAFSMETTDDFFLYFTSWKYYTKIFIFLPAVSISAPVLITAIIWTICSFLSSCMDRIITGLSYWDADSLRWVPFWIKVLSPLIVFVVIETMLFVEQTFHDIFGFTKSLASGVLEDKVKMLAAGMNIPTSRIVLTTAGYSYCGGPVTYERIHLDETLFVPFDSSLDGIEIQSKLKSQEEKVLSTVAHELCHWKQRHGLKRLAVVISFGLITAAMMLGLRIHLDNQLYIATFAGVIIIGNLTIMRLNRDQEYKADIFTASLGWGNVFVSGLAREYLKPDRITFTVSDPLFNAWYGTHPTLLETIMAVEEFGDSMHTTGTAEDE